MPRLSKWSVRSGRLRCRHLTPPPRRALQSHVCERGHKEGKELAAFLRTKTSHTWYIRLAASSFPERTRVSANDIACQEIMGVKEFRYEIACTLKRQSARNTHNRRAERHLSRSAARGRRSGEEGRERAAAVAVPCRTADGDGPRSSASLRTRSASASCPPRASIAPTSATTLASAKPCERRSGEKRGAIRVQRGANLDPERSRRRVLLSVLISRVDSVAYERC